mgnify:CR=1 FL=1
MTDVIKDLHKIIEKNIDPVMFPYEKSGRINIGSYSIIKSKDCYSIKSYKTGSIVAETFSKTAAVAIAKSLSKKQNHISRILELDHKIMKNYIDCMFYRNSLKKNKNEITREAIEVRYDISWHKVEDARKKLEHFIF